MSISASTLRRLRNTPFFVELVSNSSVFIQLHRRCNEYNLFSVEKSISYTFKPKGDDDYDDIIEITRRDENLEEIKHSKKDYHLSEWVNHLINYGFIKEQQSFYKGGRKCFLTMNGFFPF